MSVFVIQPGDDPPAAGVTQSPGAAGDGGSVQREVQQAGGGTAERKMFKVIFSYWDVFEVLLKGEAADIDLSSRWEETAHKLT